MKSVNILQIIASLCLGVTSIINLLNTFIYIPLLLRVISAPLLLISIVLYIVVLYKQYKMKRGSDK